MAKFEQFNQTDATYKTVDSHNIDLTVLTPKDLAPGKHPVILRFHGGFLICGSRLYEDWFATWILDLALHHRAILITPDYRLLPEANGTDILSDLSSLFTWLTQDLPFLLSSMGIEADLQSILTVGESAGGYLAVQSALLHPSSSRHKISACISQFGVLDLETPFYQTSFEKKILGNPMYDSSIIERHLEALQKGDLPKVVSSPRIPQRLDLTLAIVQHGRYLEFLGDPDKESKCYPMRNLQSVEKNSVPPIWLFHGTRDSAVPFEGSVAFEKRLKELHPESKVKLTLVEGKEHGCDAKLGLEDPKAGFVKEGVKWIEPFWLGKVQGHL